jgi:hypothetical protein
MKHICCYVSKVVTVFFSNYVFRFEQFATVIMFHAPLYFICISVLLLITNSKKYTYKLVSKDKVVLVLLTEYHAMKVYCGVEV